MEICGPKGRDCIERNSGKSFNCSTTCEGIYADVQYVGKKIEEDEEAEIIETESSGNAETNMLLKRLAELERKMEVVESAIGEKGEQLDKEKYKMMIAEYRKFKTKNVKHFKYNSEEISSAFGK